MTDQQNANQKEMNSFFLFDCVMSTSSYKHVCTIQIYEALNAQLQHCEVWFDFTTGCHTSVHHTVSLWADRAPMTHKFPQTVKPVK